VTTITEPPFDQLPSARRRRLVRNIAGSRYPGMKAFEALGLIVPFYLLVFASTYLVMERASAATFTQPLTRTDALYFTVTDTSL